jgi:hypothetical protein
VNFYPARLWRLQRPWLCLPLSFSPARGSARALLEVVEGSESKQSGVGGPASGVTKQCFAKRLQSVAQHQSHPSWYLLRGIACLLEKDA